MKVNSWVLAGVSVAILSCSATSYANGSCDQNQQTWQGDHKSDHQRLPDDKKQLLYKTMKASMQKDKGLRKQSQDLRRQLHGVVTASSFDQQSFMSINAQLEKIHNKIHDDRLAAFASIANQFTPQEREWIFKKMNHHHHRHGHHGQQGQWDKRSYQSGSNGEGMQYRGPSDDRSNAYPPFDARPDAGNQ